MALRFLRIVSESPEADRFATVPHAYLDGYHFGDRLLEGVMFKFEITEDGLDLRASVMPHDQAYFDDLNKEKWLAEAVAYAKKTDIFAADPTDMANTHADDDAVQYALADVDLGACVLYDDALPHHNQNFSCPQEIEIDGLKVRG